MQAVEHHHVIRPNRPQLSKQAGVCSDGLVDDVGVISECVTSDSSESGCDSLHRISAELHLPVDGINIHENCMYDHYYAMHVACRLGCDSYVCLSCTYIVT